jgi:hypothetical protein
MNWSYILAGFVIGSLGWVLYLGGLPVVGLVAGLGTGGSIGYVASGAFGAPWAPWALTLIGCIVGAALGFWLVRVFQAYLFFTAGASVGGALGYAWGAPLVAQLFGPSTLGAFLAAAAGAIAGGVLCVRLRRFVVAVITSIIGATMLAEGLPDDQYSLGLAVSLAVFLAIQVGAVRKFVDAESFDRRTRVKLKEAEAEVKSR